MNLCILYFFLFLFLFFVFIIFINAISFMNLCWLITWHELYRMNLLNCCCYM